MYWLAPQVPWLVSAVCLKTTTPWIYYQRLFLQVVEYTRPSWTVTGERRRLESRHRQFQRQCLISIILALRAPTPPWVWFASTPHHTTFPSSYYEVWSIKRAKTIGQNFDCWHCIAWLQYKHTFDIEQLMTIHLHFMHNVSSVTQLRLFSWGFDASFSPETRPVFQWWSAIHPTIQWKRIQEKGQEFLRNPPPMSWSVLY